MYVTWWFQNTLGISCKLFFEQNTLLGQNEAKSPMFFQIFWPMRAAYRGVGATLTAWVILHPTKYF